MRTRISFHRSCSTTSRQSFTEISPLPKLSCCPARCFCKIKGSSCSPKRVDGKVLEGKNYASHQVNESRSANRWFHPQHSRWDNFCHRLGGAKTDGSATGGAE